MLLNELPKECLFVILSHLSYYELNRCRFVCRKFDQISQTLIKDGFCKINELNDKVEQYINLEFQKRILVEPEMNNKKIFAFIVTSVCLTKLFLIDAHHSCTPGFILDQIFYFFRISKLFANNNGEKRVSYTIGVYIYKSLFAIHENIKVYRKACDHKHLLR